MVTFRAGAGISVVVNLGGGGCMGLVTYDGGSPTMAAVVVAPGCEGLAAAGTGRALVRLNNYTIMRRSARVCFSEIYTPNSPAIYHSNGRHKLPSELCHSGPRCFMTRFVIHNTSVEICTAA